MDIKVRSVALNEDRRVVILLPPGYNDRSPRSYASLYLLHGNGGCNLPKSEWEQWGLQDKVEAMTLTGQIQPMIIILPDGFMADCKPSYFFNHSPNLDGKRWGDYIWQDVVSYIDKNFRTISTGQSRAIGGYSLGGQGALSLALLHPDVFRVVGGHSPSFRGADNSVDAIRDDADWFKNYDPIWLVKNTQTASQLKIWIDVGFEDDYWRNCSGGSERCILAFHSLLDIRGFLHEWHGDWPGRHEGTYWGPHIPDYLAWYSAQLRGE